MTYKYILIAVFACIFCGCSKSDKLSDDEDSSPEPPAQINALGTWTLSSTTSADRTFESDQIPCIKNNILVVSNDGRASFIYTAADTCYVYRDASSSMSYGRKGDSSALSWSQSGNIFKIALISDPTAEAYGRLQMAGTSRQLTIRDTMPTGLILQSIYKQ